MKQSCFRSVFIAVLALFIVPLGVHAQIQPSVQPKYYDTPENLIAEIYKAVTFIKEDPLPDWEKVRSMFISDAIIVMRVSRDSMAVFSVKGFIDDFVNFVEKSPAKNAGFIERILKMNPMVFGNIAHILVLYEASITGMKNPPTLGVDSWHLLKKNGRWWITSVANDIITKDRPVPDELK
jgi:hypothetical protein